MMTLLRLRPLGSDSRLGNPFQHVSRSLPSSYLPLSFAYRNFDSPYEKMIFHGGFTTKLRLDYLLASFRLVLLIEILIRHM